MNCSEKYKYKGFTQIQELSDKYTNSEIPLYMMIQDTSGIYFVMFMKQTYKGKEYEVQTGPRGGLFFIDDNGKRHSVKSDKPKKKVTKEKKSEKVDPSKKVLPQITPNLKRYICYYEERNEKDFSEKLIWALTHSKEAAVIGENGKKVALKMFNSEIETRKIISIFQS